MSQYDVIVIGGGPGGLSAAVNVRARNKSVLVVSNPVEENPLWRSDLVDNHVGMPQMSGSEMLTAMVDHAKEKGVDFLSGKALTAMKLDSGFFLSVGTDVVEGRAVILAPGLSRAKKFPGEEDFIGRGVSYCATCDGFAYRGKAVAVVGYTPSAQHEATYLEEMGCQVQYIPSPKQVAILGQDKVSAIEWDAQKLAVDGVFILRPSMAPTDLFPDLAVENGYIQVNHKMETNLEGVFAAGDCTGTPLQVSKAVGEGLVAGQNAASYARAHTVSI